MMRSLALLVACPITLALILPLPSTVVRLQARSRSPVLFSIPPNLNPSTQRLTQDDYERIFALPPSNTSTSTLGTTRPALVTQDEWQQQLLSSSNPKPGTNSNTPPIINPYAEMTNWYLQSWRESSVEEDISHWGIGYEDYVAEYVSEFQRLIPVKSGDVVFDSATGSGWLIRGLLEETPNQSFSRGGPRGWLRRWMGSSNTKADEPQTPVDLTTVEWYGNDILPDALQLARRDIPNGHFYLGDSANLTWVPPSTFDVSICGYLEASPDAIEGGGFPIRELRNWVGNWVYQMTRITKPGGCVCIGAIQTVLDNGYCDEAEVISMDSGGGWWVDTARSDVYGWGVDPDSIEVLELGSRLLEEEWGPRYCVKMVKTNTQHNHPNQTN